jgi:hypothetical protein
MIVSGTRNGLRDEFTMANEAFALSPISARAAEPSEQDYDAISEAFMETSRGRWFLGEYAKRNRNADTRMVLDAVARIEESIAAQRERASESAVVEALVAIRHAVVEARAAASAALDNLALEENLAPVRKGARVMREISWRWREIGADSRICDLIDSQVNAIADACGQISSKDPLHELSAAFDLIEARIEELAEHDTIAPHPAEGSVAPPSPAYPPAPPGEMPVTVRDTMEATNSTDDVEAPANAPAMPAEPVIAMIPVLEVVAEPAEAGADAAEATTKSADAHDDAILDMIALEMSAPDVTGADDSFDPDAEEMQVAELTPADTEILVESPQPTAAATQPPTIQLSAGPSFEPSLEASLGSALIASGIVRRPHAAAADPLAPIRRMSQAEKIAFFS